MSKKTTVAAYTTRTGRHVPAHKRARRGTGTKSKTAAKSAPKPATLSELPEVLPVEQVAAPVVVEVAPVAAPKAPEPKHDDSALIFGVLTVLALFCAVGAYVVLFGVLDSFYHGMGAAFRSLVPLAVEAIMGYVAHRLIGGKHMLLATGAMLVILGCAATEIDAAQTMPAVAKRERVGHVLETPVQTADVRPAAAEGVHGKQGVLQAEQNAGKALDLQGARDEQARKDHQAALDNASTEIPGEGRLAIELAILGAIGSSCLLPLFEAFLAARRRRMA